MDSTDYSQDATDVYESLGRAIFLEDFLGLCKYMSVVSPEQRCQFATTAEEGQGFEFRRTLSKSQDYDLG